jgi:hypothetical protein
MLLAFAEAKRYPKLPPGIDTELGWIALAFLVCFAVWAWSRAPWLKRAVFGGEDPRIYAAIRIMLSVATIGCFWNLEPYWHMLWSDEGVFTLAEARQRLGRTAMSGWSVEAGFFDWWAVAKFIWTKPTLWLLRGEPEYVDLLMWVYFGLLVLYGIGFRTRVTGLLCWMALNHIYGRNALYLEGTDTVYRVLWFLVIFARTDRAWSVDNWLRRLRTRNQPEVGEPRGVIDLGLLADRFLSVAWAGLWIWLISRELGVDAWLTESPALLVWLGVVGAVFVEAMLRTRPRFAEGKDRYLLVPRWVRVMMIVQYACLYTTTGWVKSGAVWSRGDALYYAINMDHFSRFDGLNQWVSAYLGTNMYKVMTWVTHFWENFFFVVLLGVWLAFRHHHRERAWALAAEASRPRRVVRRLSLVGMWAATGVIFYRSIPYMFALNKKGEETMTAGWPEAFAWSWGVGVPVLLLIVGLLNWWSPTIRVPLGRGPDARRLEITLDAEFVRRWTVGRRVWLTLGFVFHGILIAFMNIGWFPLVMLGGYLCFLDSRELVSFLRVFTPKRWREHAAFTFAARRGDQVDRNEAMQEGRRGDAIISDDWIMLWLGAGVALALARAEPLPLLQPYFGPLMLLGAVFGLIGLTVGAHRYASDGLSGFAWGWTLAAFGGSLFALTYAGGLSIEAGEMSKQEFAEATGRALKLWGLAAVLIAGWTLTRKRSRPAERPHLMGNAVTRTLILCVCMWHAGAIGVKLMPNYPIWGTWQSPARRVFGSWLRATKTQQSWRMFAPNPPRANSFMKTVLVDGDGVYWDLRNNSLDTYPNPFWVNDRMRKMQRRMVGKGKWYLRYWTAYHCRHWELEHGKAAKEIQIYKVTTRIPKPEKSKGKPWNPRKQKRTTTFVQRHTCAKRGRPTPDEKQRRGIELDELDMEFIEKAAKEATRDHESRTKSWSRRRDFGGDPLKGSDAKKATLRPAAIGTDSRTPGRKVDPVRRDEGGQGRELSPTTGSRTPAGGNAPVPNSASGRGLGSPASSIPTSPAKIAPTAGGVTGETPQGPRAEIPAGTPASESAVEPAQK